MKHIFIRNLCLFTLLFIFETCQKEIKSNGSGSGGTVYPPPPPPPLGPAHAPIANAGNDTTLYVPFSAYKLDASASSDSDKNIISYRWKLNHGPKSVSISTSSNKAKAFAEGMTKTGVYEYEVTVTDATNLFSRDTINITVKEPNCVNPNNEIILKNLSWDFSWIMEIDILNLFSILPPGTFLKDIYIKRASSNTWELVSPMDLYSPNYGKIHEWEYGNGILVIFPPITNMINDKPDIKLVYCN